MGEFNWWELTLDGRSCERAIYVLEQRVGTLERELDAAISAAARARTEKRQAEAAQKAAELRAQEVTRELENTTSETTSFPYTTSPPTTVSLAQWKLSKTSTQS